MGLQTPMEQIEGGTGMIIDRLRASLTARMQNWAGKHYELTKAGRNLAKFKDIHKGERCFIIGNGPSLRAGDLTLLQNQGEITFGFNRIYNIFDQTPWRPTYYISQDEKMLIGSVAEVNAHEMGVKFIPAQMRWWHNIPIHDAVEFNIIDQQVEDPMVFGFSGDFAKGIYHSSTCVYTAAQIAAYMGFSEIYLIGIDHHFRVSMNNQGQIVVDHNAKDYFSDKYNADKDKLYIPNTEKSTLTYVAMKEHCEKLGVQVCNATRGGKLEVFQRVDFDALFDT